MTVNIQYIILLHFLPEIHPEDWITRTYPISEKKILILNNSFSRFDPDSDYLLNNCALVSLNDLMFYLLRPFVHLEIGLCPLCRLLSTLSFNLSPAAIGEKVYIMFLASSSGALALSIQPSCDHVSCIHEELCSVSHGNNRPNQCSTGSCEHGAVGCCLLWLIASP